MSVGDKCCSNGMHGCHNNNNSSSNIPLATPAITTTTAAAIMTTHMGHTKAFGAQFDVKRARTEGELGGSSIQIAVLGLCRRHILFPPTCCYYYCPPKKQTEMVAEKWATQLVTGNQKAATETSSQ